MRFAELTIGTDYLLASDNAWETKSYAQVERVRLVSTKRYTKRRYDLSVSEYSKGAYVAVTPISRVTGEPYKQGDGSNRVDYVAYAHLRGPWDEASKRRDANLAADQAANAEQDRRNEQAKAAAYEQRDRAERAGLCAQVLVETGYRSDYGTVPQRDYFVKVEVADLATFLDHLEPGKNDH